MNLTHFENLKGDHLFLYEPGQGFSVFLMGAPLLSKVFSTDVHPFI